MDHCTERFRRFKAHHEKRTIRFTPGNLESYNIPSSLDELQTAHDFAADPDDVHYQMLKNLPDLVLKTLNMFFQRLMANGWIPQNWSDAAIISTPSQEKTPLLLTTIDLLPWPGVFAIPLNALFKLPCLISEIYIIFWQNTKAVFASVVVPLISLLGWKAISVKRLYAVSMWCLFSLILSRRMTRHGSTAYFVTCMTLDFEVANLILYATFWPTDLSVCAHAFLVPTNRKWNCHKAAFYQSHYLF